ncbi:MAG: HlyD family type I secretion periplasmic adaptor subunit [Hyphomicrobiaceae bacterium]
MNRLEHAFANDVDAALDRQGSRSAWPVLMITGLGIVSGLVWAHFAILDEVTHGEGRVIPSSQVQVVQPLEGGIIAEIKVKEGQRVSVGEPLIRIDDVSFSSSLGELKQKRMALSARKVRLDAESSGTEPSFADAGLDRAMIGAELLLYKSRQASLAEELAVVEQQLAQRRLERIEIETRLDESKATSAFAQRELELGRNLKRSGAYPEMELLRLERQYRTEQRDIAVLAASLPRTAAAITEATAKIQATILTFRARASEGLGEANANLAVIDESLKAAEDRVRRTLLRSPVNGIVNKLVVTTIGAVVRPGESIAEIVPIEDKLLVEARVRPQDVAFIHPGQTASVKITAYNYTVYGDMLGVVERIGADTIPDEKGNPYFRVILRTDNNHLGNDKDALPIIPGMVVTADIRTGRKSVLDYLLRPIQVARHEALRER